MTEVPDHTCVRLSTSDYQQCDRGPGRCPVDYDKFQMCNGNYCRCTESGCRAPFLLTTRLDLVITDERMEGILLNGVYAGAGPIKLRWVE